MPITKKQKELRRKHLGSSDVAAILGLDRFRNAYDVWLEKTGQVDEQKENEAMQAGTFFEDGVLRFAEEKLGPLKRNQYRVATGFPLASNIDALVVGSNEPVEAKTAGLFSRLPEDWGDEGTDEIPDYIIIQTHVHMICVEREICHVPTFLGGRGFQLFRVNWDNEIMDVIRDKSLDFWENFVENKQPPPDVMPSIEVAKRMKRLPGKIVEIETQIVQNWLNAKDNLKYANLMKEGAESEMLAALGEAEAGKCDLGLVTYFEQQQRRIDSQRLKEEKPEIAAEYLKVSKFRVARFKKPKPPKGAIL
jgi:putative phage-type endonuclease